MLQLRRSVAIPAILSAVLLLCAWQEAPVTRAAVDALDKTTADVRAARVSDVSYDVSIDLSDGDEAFTGEVFIEFALSNAESDLTLDFNGGTLLEVKVNGEVISPEYNGFFITLPAEQLKTEQNLVVISYSRPYGHDGTGLHRFKDPEDGLNYMHSYLWPYYANRVLPSFDQPNLKAEFSLDVVAPEEWTVVSTMPVARVQTRSDLDTRHWEFEKTPRISTYVFSLHAGSYKIWSDDSGDVPLRLMARQSLAKYVAAEEWLATTQKGMTYFGNYFDIPYPFPKYDQLIVPEFNIGGMENVAAVTYTEGYVQRQESSRAERERRTSTILHELAHMWFGDLVTHDWWNGMWLNESFATQMATLAQLEVTEFTDKWHGNFTSAKQAAYSRDSKVTTHPIEMPVASTDQFTELFDAITYQKGGAALRQLQHRVGAENYRLGVSAYLKENAYGTTELADFIGHQSNASGIDLRGWSDEWLMRPGFNTLAAAPVCEEDILKSLSITQTVPAAWPVLRTHQASVAFYNFDAAGDLRVTTELPVTISGASTAIDIPDGIACPTLINPNFDDWTYARIAISDADEAVLATDLGKISDPLSRSMFLRALFDRAATGDMPLADYVRQVLVLVETEQNFRVLEQITSSLSYSINRMQRLRPDTNEVLPRLLDDVEVLGLKRAHFAATHDLKQLWFGLFLSVAASDAALGTTRALLDGKTDLDGVEISADVRWQLLTILSRYNAPDIEELLAAEIKRDPSDVGQRKLLGAQAAAPSLANKEHWVDELQSPKTITNLSKQRAVMGQLFPATQTDLQLPLLTKILSSLPQMSRDADSYFLSSYTTSMLTPMCTTESSALMQTTLDEFGEQLNPTALRFLREAHQRDVECEAMRAAQ